MGCISTDLQKEFVRLIQSSGVLVVLSQAWIEELYHQVLERNLLAEAGYWGSPEDHARPLITMLTGTGSGTNHMVKAKLMTYYDIATLSMFLQISMVWAAVLSAVS